MNRIEIESNVGPDGILSLVVPIGQQEANQAVHVTIEPANGNGNGGFSNWQELVDKLYGSCSDLGLERPEQGYFEERESIE